MLLTHSQIVEYSQSQLVLSSSAENATCNGVTWDSRNVVPGNLYLAITGDRVCGHDYIRSAIDSKASAVMISKEIPQSTLDYAKAHGVSVMRCKDPIEALTNLAKQWNINHLSQSIVIGVTGSSGKTSTKNILHHVLSQYFSCSATMGNQNNELGVPYTLLCADPGDAFIIVEMGMRAAGQINHLCEIAFPELGVITNIGCAHIELLHSVEAIANAKGELICNLQQCTPEKIRALGAIMETRGWTCNLPSKASFAFANFVDAQKISDINEFFADNHPATKLVLNDMPNNQSLDEKSKVKESGLTSLTGVSKSPYVHGAFISNIKLDENACPTFDIGINSEIIQCKLKLQGIHSAHNAALVASLCYRIGIPLVAIVQALESCEPVQGRQEVLSLSCGSTLIMDCYNANPDSMRASLKVLGKMSGSGKKIAVLGDMGELGELAMRSHLDIGEQVVLEKIDRMICCGELAQAYCTGAIEAGMSPDCVAHFKDKTELISYLTDVICANDIILLKASRSCKFEEIAEGLK